MEVKKKETIKTKGKYVIRNKQTNKLTNYIKEKIVKYRTASINESKRKKKKDIMYKCWVWIPRSGHFFLFLFFYGGVDLGFFLSFRMKTRIRQTTDFKPMQHY